MPNTKTLPPISLPPQSQALSLERKKRRQAQSPSLSFSSSSIFLPHRSPLPPFPLLDPPSRSMTKNKGWGLETSRSYPLLDRDRKLSLIIPLDPHWRSMVACEITVDDCENTDQSGLRPSSPQSSLSSIRERSP